ncbi:MAG: BLUF domain-containing protein [Proteobacteria bacterium]|nr:BLUF domain-containing protein [Pseudomonadota bacterium]
MNLIQLIYLSSLSDIRLEHEIGKILESSVRNNNENGITGMLLYANGNFLQVLEGERNAVEEAFARICADPRHYDIIVLLREPIAQRNFSQWSMGYQHLNEHDIRAFPKCAPLFKFRDNDEAIRAEPGIALELLRQFSIDNR